MSTVAPTGPVYPTGAKAWIAGARPRTLPAAVVPVAVGTAVAYHDARALYGRALLALVVSLALQIGVNYANDYSDGIRGTDEVRVGPIRLVGAHIFSAKAVKFAAFAAFGIAAIAGLVLALQTTPWLIVVGVVAIGAAWFYTGGPRPYGYAGLGELFVFLFFGLVAVVGTVFVQTEKVSALSFVAAVPVGLLAVALLIINNLRDIPGDSNVGKKTLAVRLGDAKTRTLYIAVVVGAILFAFPIALVARAPFVLLGLVALAVAVAPLKTVRGGTAGRGLIPVLGATSRVHLVFGIAVSLGLLIK